MAGGSETVLDLLRARGRPVVTAGPGDTVKAAIQKLVENRIGALPVCDTSGAVVGIVSERDFLHECLQQPERIGRTKVSDIMTTEVLIGVPGDTLEYVMDIMTQRSIRHLPIMDGPELYGMVSMRDVVDALLDQSKAQVRFLSDYISGGFR